MTTASALPPNTPVVDEDLAEQARPGYGIPSQDPRPEAQHGLAPEGAERESRSVLAGGGAMVGAAAGAGIGAVVGGPLGAVVGGTLGTVAGVLSAVAGTPAHQADPTEPVHLHVEDSGGTGQPVVLIHG